MPAGRPSRATVYRRLDDALVELRERLGGLPSPREARSIWADIWHLEAHHSTALEGNTLVLREVEALLDSGKAVGSKPLKEYMEVKGYGDAATWVYEQALTPDRDSGALITVQEVRSIHHAIMTPVWGVAPHPHATDAESPGNFRQHDIQAFDEGMTPPSHPLVPALVSGWVEAVNDPESGLRGPSDLPFPDRIALAHNEFERIHPFIDGNGRAGRLALNLILVRLGYPPVVILKQSRASYLAAMQRADAGDPGRLGELLARAMQDSLNRFILPNVAGPARMVPLAALADERFSVAALRQAAQRGRLDAYQGSDGIWRSSRHAIDAYQRSLHQRAQRRTRRP